MLKLRRLLAEKRDLHTLQREVEELRKENATLRAKNESMREGMRRCVSCDYRLDYKERQGEAPIKIKND